MCWSILPDCATKQQKVYDLTKEVPLSETSDKLDDGVRCMRVRIGHWVAGAFLVGVMVVGGFLLIPALQRSLDESEQSNADSDSPVTETQDSSSDSSELDLINEVSTHDDLSLDLWIACPDPAAENLPNACLLAIDQFFLDMQYGHQVNVKGPVFTRLEYSRVFLDPGKDRRLVFEALRREECFPDDDDLRGPSSNYEELRELCHAESFSNYAEFNAICSEFRGGKDAELNWIGSSWNVYSGISKFEHFESAFQDSLESIDETKVSESRKDWLWREVLEARWLKQKCAQFSSVPVMDAVNDVAEYELLSSHSLRIALAFDRKWEPTNASSIIYKGLIGLAGYLGGASTYEGYRQGGEAWKELVYGKQYDENFAKYPWRLKLDRGELGPSHSRILRFDVARTTVLRFEDEGIEFDWYWLVESVCRESEYQGTDARGRVSCRELVHNIRNQLAEGEEMLLQMEEERIYFENAKYDEWFSRFLSKFEQIALELGLYD